MPIVFGREQTIRFDGREYTLDKLRNRHLLAIVKKIKDNYGDLLAPAERFQDKLESADLKDVIREAVAFGRRLDGMYFGDPLVEEYARSPEGSWHLVSLLLSKHHPGISEDEIDDVADEIKRSEKEAATVATATGSVPNEPEAPSSGAGQAKQSTGGRSATASGTTPRT